MRVIAGKNRGAKLMSLEGNNTRPTSDRIKETLFNIINQQLLGANVLDLFSGSGSLGIECVSRGADFATLVENFPEAIQVINSNVAHTKNEEKIKVIKSDVMEYLKKNKSGDKYDVIFLDPPYLHDYEALVLELLYEGDFLTDDGIIVVEHSSKTNVDNHYFEIYREKEYKVTSLTFMRKK